MSKEQYLECGKILNTHGVRGACKIDAWCDSPTVLCTLKRMYYKKNDELVALTVEKASVHKGCALVYFHEIHDIEEAQKLKNRILYADRNDLSLPDDRVFVADLIGLPVFEEATGAPLGEMLEVIESPASDLFCVRTPDGREVLVPAVDEFIGHIDDTGVFLCPISGMFDNGAEGMPSPDVGDEDEI